MGRPSKLTPAVHDIIVQALASGCYRETAATCAGIAVSTFYNWMERGEADIEHGKKTPYMELVEAINKAEAQAELDALEMIRKAAPKNWNAAAWMLERKNPAKWGRRTAVEHSGSIDPGLEHGAKIADAVSAALKDLGVDVTDEDVRAKIGERLRATSAGQ